MPRKEKTLEQVMEAAEDKAIVLAMILCQVPPLHAAEVIGRIVGSILLHMDPKDATRDAAVLREIEREAYEFRDEILNGDPDDADSPV